MTLRATALISAALAAACAASLGCGQETTASTPRGHKFVDPGDHTYDSIRQAYARAASTGFTAIR